MNRVWIVLKIDGRTKCIMGVRNTPSKAIELRELLESQFEDDSFCTEVWDVL
jgi:hypothetical protein